MFRYLFVCLFVFVNLEPSSRQWQLAGHDVENTVGCRSRALTATVPWPTCARNFRVRHQRVVRATRARWDTEVVLCSLFRYPLSKNNNNNNKNQLNWGTEIKLREPFRTNFLSLVHRLFYPLDKPCSVRARSIKGCFHIDIANLKEEWTEFKQADASSRESYKNCTPQWRQSEITTSPLSNVIFFTFSKLISAHFPLIIRLLKATTRLHVLMDAHLLKITILMCDRDAPVT